MSYGFIIQLFRRLVHDMKPHHCQASWYHDLSSREDALGSHDPLLSPTAQRPPLTQTGERRLVLSELNLTARRARRTTRYFSAESVICSHCHFPLDSPSISSIYAIHPSQSDKIPGTRGLRCKVVLITSFSRLWAFPARKLRC